MSTDTLLPDWDIDALPEVAQLAHEYAVWLVQGKSEGRPAPCPPELLPTTLIAHCSVLASDVAHLVELVQSVKACLDGVGAPTHADGRQFTLAERITQMSYDLTTKVRGYERATQAIYEALQEAPDATPE